MSESKKIVFIGPHGAGKTSLVQAFLYSSFNPNYKATIGVDYFEKTIKVGNSRLIKLQMWDTAGQERFNSLAPSYLRNAKVVVVAANVNDEACVEKTRKWIQMAEECTVEGTPLVICGTKVDLERKSQIQARMFPMHTFAETSATTGQGVENLFVAIAALSVQGVPEPVVNEPMDLVLEYNKVEENSQSSCCF